MIAKPTKPSRGRRRSVQTVDVIVREVPKEDEAQLVQRIARFLFDLTKPDEKAQPHTLD